jgi:hypothetical protein
MALLRLDSLDLFIVMWSYVVCHSASMFKITWEPLYISLILIPILAGLINVNYFSSFAPIRPYITSRQQIPVVLTNATLVVDLTGNVQYQAFIVCSTTVFNLLLLSTHTLFDTTSSNYPNFDPPTPFLPTFSPSLSPPCPTNVTTSTQTLLNTHSFIPAPKLYSTLPFLLLVA